MRAAIYARVSTGNQDEGNQLPEIKALIKRRGFELIRTYQEQASAWKAGRQKQLSKLIQDAQGGDFDCLVVWSLDRLTREGAHKILMLYKKLEDLGISVISVKEDWTEAPSTTKPLLLAIMGWIAEQEARRHSERIKAGIAKKKAAGGKVGRPAGAVDKKKRSNSGYLLRQSRDRIARAERGEL
jgi:DNA invertase Pin-like site-specific DNA recombinase